MTSLPGSAAPPPAMDDAVEVLAPRGGGPLSTFLAHGRAGDDAPFAEARRAAIGALSATFLADPDVRSDPASVAAAFWMRPAALGRLAESFASKQSVQPDTVRVPVGRVFHVAPANVDTLFLYSWTLSFLCGNANVVRVSRQRPPLVDAMLRAIDRVAADHPALGDENRFVTYEHDARVNAVLSRWCSHRIVWGGDETVAALRESPLGPHASERVFGSKFSYAVVAAAPYLAAEDAAQERLAAGFFNDVFWFDQMACSSPHVVFWVGTDATVERAVARFDARLDDEVRRRGWTAAVPDAVRRVQQAFELAVEADVRVELDHPGFVAVRVHERAGLAKQACGGGLIRHARVADLAELVAYASETDQTVTHFGFESGALRSLAASAGARGVDRLVPIGQALAFDAVWDGFDLIDDFTRRVTVRS